MRLPPTCCTHARRSKRGMALLMAMIVITLYVIIAAHYIYLTTTYNQVIANQRNDVIAYWAARGGIYEGRAYLKLDTEMSFDSLNEAWATTAPNSTNESSESSSDSGTGVNNKVTVDPPYTSDEESRFNILLLQYQTTEAMEKNIQEAFMRLIDLCRRNDERIVLTEGEPVRRVRRADEGDSSPAKIYDGIRRYLQSRENDAGDEPSFDSTRRSSSRMKKQSPYTLLTMGELMLAEGLTPEIMRGDPARTAQRQREYEEQRKEEQEGHGSSRRPRLGNDGVDYDPLTGRQLYGDAKAKYQTAAERYKWLDQRSGLPEPLPLEEFITIWGDGKVNINTAPREVLLALSPSMTWAMASDILFAREKARQRQQAVETGTEADPNAATDPNNPQNAEQDTASFRNAQMASALAFYNHVMSNKKDAATGEQGQPAASANEVPEEWRKTFDELKPFITVRSRYFRVTSTATAGKITKEFFAVFRRDRPGGAGARSTGGTGGARGTPGPSPGNQASPAEIDTIMSMIFLDERERPAAKEPKKNN